MRALIRNGAYQALALSGQLDRRRVRAVEAGEGWCSVLVFHRVSDVDQEDGVTITQARFRRILSLLRERYVVIGASELVGRISSRKPLTGREVVITFDDGYLDNATHAAPLLLEKGLPATFFLTAGYIGTNKRFPWDIAKSISAPAMAWHDARELHQAGFEIGCHTYTHPNLGTEPVAHAAHELTEAKELIEDKVGAVVNHFAYPFGSRQNIRPEWIAEVKARGFASLFSGFGGTATNRDSPFWIPRMGASHQRTLTALLIDIDQAW